MINAKYSTIFCAILVLKGMTLVNPVTFFLGTCDSPCSLLSSTISTTL